MKLRTIEVDAHGRSDIVAVNGQKDFEVGSYGDCIFAGDEVELNDGSAWIVEKVYSHIQTGGAGKSNFTAVDLKKDN